MGEPVFSSTSGTWKDRDQRDDRGTGASHMFGGAWLLLLPRYDNW